MMKSDSFANLYDSSGYLDSLIYNRFLKIGICSLNQTAMDFEGNKRRIIKSIEECLDKGCKIRIGPELEVTGYTCEDHFFEPDTINHNWEVIAEIISLGYTDNIVCDLGCVVIYNNCLYNCRVFIYKRKVLLIRPKMILADDGNYRESRWFTKWTKGSELVDFYLPQCIKQFNDQKTVKMGVSIIKFDDVEICSEICEELWVSKSPSHDLCLNGAEIIINNSGSHSGINKYKVRYEYLNSQSSKNGGCYIYANLLGCDGGRLYFDGGSFACLNGNLVSDLKLSRLIDVDITEVIVDLNEIKKFRLNKKSQFGMQDSSFLVYEKIIVNETLCSTEMKSRNVNIKKFIENITFEKTVIDNITGYLFDYLRKSGGNGFFLPLSGGSDSGVVALLVSYMCRRIMKEILLDNQFVIKSVKKIVKDENFIPKSEKELCSKILFSSYLSTKFNSDETRKSAEFISNEIGCSHVEVDIEKIYDQFKLTINSSLNISPKFLSEGGSFSEDLSLQNLQSRIRMVTSYLLSQVIPIKFNLKGFLLVLASGNLDEAQIGYLTKYDCSSGDLNPIGSLSKVNLKSILKYLYDVEKYESVANLLKLVPSAELRPTTNEKQSDEADIGFTYEELNTIHELRSIQKCGPLSMFFNLRNIWINLSDSEIFDKVKRFFKRYSQNRHKNTVLTPSIYLNEISNDDNRYDLRPFLYDNNWTYQFKRIEDFISKKKQEEDISNILDLNESIIKFEEKSINLNESKSHDNVNLLKNECKNLLQKNKKNNVQDNNQLLNKKTVNLSNNSNQNQKSNSLSNFHVHKLAKDSFQIKKEEKMNKNLK